MFKDKKAQSASNAALLIIVIAAGIILYMLFLPPDERARILEEDFNGDDDNNDGLLHDLDGKILISESPGRLDSLESDVFDHKISSFSLYSSTESGVIREVNSLYVSRSVFNKKDYVFEFSVFDKSLMNNFLLGFTKEEGSGILSISLNDRVISEKFFDKTNPEPISLPKDYIRSGKNTLSFSVSSPGILFFLTNKYQLSGVKIFADVTDDSALRGQHTFFTSKIEVDNLESATATFYVDCLSDELGVIEVLLNNFLVYSSAADCRSFAKISLNPKYIVSGVNTLSFTADKGSYIIDQFEITTTLDEPIYPVYYFEVEQDELELIIDYDLEVNLSMSFVEKNDEDNQVEVQINNRRFTVDEEKLFNERINTYVEEGNNFVKVSPVEGTVNLVDLKVFYAERD
ncbi:hypothetical protein GOV05_04435 [Candidatus Woesearchaeota archaeon]|nr:hypothetical protein [Candidatus Woesearchaeota archaeon]